MNDPIRKAGLLLPVLRRSAESWGNHHCAGELRRAIDLIEELSAATPATAHGGSAAAVGVVSRMDDFDVVDCPACGKCVQVIRHCPHESPPAGGFVVVPREATHDMEYALSQALDSGDYSIGECLNRANAAAPESNSRPKSGIALGTEIEGIPWTEEMEDTFNKTMPKVRELVGLSSPSASGVVAYMVDGRVEQGLFFDKEAAENMASANCGTVIPLTASPTAQPSAKDGVREIK